MPRLRRTGTVETEAPAPDEVVFLGATISQLKTIFAMDVRTIKGKISEIKPSGQRNGSPFWRIRDVAPYLVKPVGDFEAALRNMSHEDLPPNLRKEFWHAKRQEQAYKKEAAELWPTEDVQVAFSEAFKTLRTELLLLGEAVEREVSLPERAREILKANIDATMNNMRENLIVKFDAPDPDAPPPPDEDWDIRVVREEEGEGDEDEFQGL